MDIASAFDNSHSQFSINNNEIFDGHDHQAPVAMPSNLMTTGEQDPLYLVIPAVQYLLKNLLLRLISQLCPQQLRK